MTNAKGERMTRIVVIAVLKRMAAHATNIGEWAICSTTGELGRLKSYHPASFPAALLSLG
jgi:hypothetical protein